MSPTLKQEPAPPIAAASLILLRPGRAGLEVLLLERAAGLAFAGGALVFPGGRVDPADHAAIAGADDPAEAAARRAALRETAEETGLVLSGSQAARLVPFAHWIAPADLPRRFDTRFYVVEAPAGAEPRADGVEAVAAGWFAPATALDPGHRLLFPTRRILERLACSPDLDAALAEARRHPPRPITPWIEERAGELWACIPDDAGYPVTAERLSTAVRA